MAKVVIRYLEVQKIEVDLGDEIVNKWDNKKASLYDLVKEMIETNQSPKLEEPNLLWCGRIISTETKNRFEESEDDLRVDGKYC